MPKYRRERISAVATLIDLDASAEQLARAARRADADDIAHARALIEHQIRNAEERLRELDARVAGEFVTT